MKTINKSQLKKDYYWEFRPFYDALPDELPVPEYSEHVFERTMTNREIVEAFEKVPFTVEQAFAAAAEFSERIEKGQWRIVYFRDIDGTPCRLYVWRDGDGKLHLGVRKVDPDSLRYAGDGVLVSKRRYITLPFETESLDLGSLDPLSGRKP